MRKPWSISTTVRNPERLRNFLRVLKQLKGEDFTKDKQVKYQILLIKKGLPKIFSLTFIPPTESFTCNTSISYKDRIFS